MTPLVPLKMLLHDIGLCWQQPCRRVWQWKRRQPERPPLRPLLVFIPRNASSHFKINSVRPSAAIGVDLTCFSVADLPGCVEHVPLRCIMHWQHRCHTSACYLFSCPIVSVGEAASVD